MYFSDSISPCRLEGSRDASGFILQKSKASLFFGKTESPSLPHCESSFHHGTSLMFPLAAGKTVSPPSSTSELRSTIKDGRLITYHIVANEKDCKVTLQVHKDGSNSLSSFLDVEIIKEIVMVRLIFLPNFIMQNLKSFSIFCMLHYINT